MNLHRNFNIELLAPAGEPESLRAAVLCGANAVYLGLQAFSARVSADNFSNDEFIEGVRFAHLHNVNVYVTLNTLIRDDEWEEALACVEFVVSHGADGILVQDIGLFRAIRDMYPDFPVHISTQMSVTSLEAVKYFEELGVRRVVLARETTIESVRSMTENCDVEIEVFAHGALCIAYSGQCLMSSMIGHRSGNRGACAQTCRMRWSLLEDGETLEDQRFLLSGRDLNTIEHVQDWIDAGVTSLKIEGRMKRPEYVAAIVLAYRKAIDHALNQNEPEVSDDNIMNMRRMFHREETSGFPFHDKHIVDRDFSGNKGLPVGHVVRYESKKRKVYVRLTDTLTQGDHIIFPDKDLGRAVNKMEKNGLLVREAEAGDLVAIEFDQPVTGEVRRTLQTSTLNDMRSAYAREQAVRRVDMTLEMNAWAPMVLTLTCDSHTVSVVSDDLAEPAQSQPMDVNRIRKQLAKTGGTVFKAGTINIQMHDDLFVRMSALNALRRHGLELLTEELLETPVYEKHDIHKQTLNQTSVPEDYVTVLTTAQLEAALECRNNVYIDIDALNQKALDLFEAKGITPGVAVPAARDNNDLKNMSENKYLEKCGRLLVNDYGTMRLFADKELVLGPGFNVFNARSAGYFDHPVVASWECGRGDVKAMKEANGQLIVPVYGRPLNMITRHCMITEYLNGCDQKHCGRCAGHTYEAIDRTGASFPLMTDKACRNYIYHHTPRAWGRLSEYSALYVFTDESQETIRAMLRG